MANVKLSDEAYLSPSATAFINAEGAQVSSLNLPLRASGLMGKQPVIFLSVYFI